MRSPTSKLAELLCCVLLIVAATTAHAQTEELTKEQAEKLVEDSAALYRSGDTAGALTNLQRALAHYERVADRNGAGDVLYARGIVLNKTGAHAKAVADLTASLAIQREIGDEEGEAIVLHELAFAQKDLRQFPQSIESFERERAIAARRADRKAEAEALHNIASIRGAALGENEQGIALLAEALKIRQEIGDREGEAGDLDVTAFLLLRLNRREQAISHYEQSLQLWRALGNTEEVEQIEAQLTKLRAAGGASANPPTAKQRTQSQQADEQNEECVRLSRAGESAKASAKCERAAALYRNAGNRGGESMALANMSTASFAKGDYAKAMELAQRALLLARQIGSEDAQANPLNQIGLIHLVWAQYPQALTHFERVLAIQRKHGDGSGEDRTLGNIAALRVVLGQDAQAIEIWKALLPRQRYAERAQTLLNLGAVHARNKRFPEALEHLEAALALQRSTKDRLVRTTLANLGTVHAELREYDKAMKLFEEALALDLEMGDRLSESGALGQIAYIRSQQGDSAGALKSYEQALAIARELGEPTAQSAWLAGIGRVMEAQGKDEPALSAYLQAIEIEETIRAGGRAEEIKMGLGARSTEVYQRAVRLLVRRGKADEAFDLAERARARAFLDQLGNTRIEARPAGPQNAVTRERELRLAWVGLDHLLQQERTRPRSEQDAQRIRSLTEQLARKRAEYGEELVRLKSSNPEYASLVSVSPLKVAEVQRLLESDTALVSYFVTPDETLAFVVTQSALDVVRMPVSETELTSAIAELRSFASIGREPPPALARLSSWLVAPVRPLLKTSFVGIVPHGPLHLLPFAALSGAGASAYLADEYTLFHLPAASALPFIQQKRKTSQGSTLVLAQGHAEGLPPLRHAEEEAGAVAALYGARVLTGSGATESALRAGAEAASILHIAAHGQLNSATPLFSRLVLAPDEILDAARDGSLEVREIYALDLKKANLVVLSACQTQLGVRSGGDDIVGLSRAFIYAGTPTVVASLWSVDDVATSELMTAFHRHLREGLGKAAALRAAQRETRVKHPDPFYWAAFMLTGDPK